MNKTILSTVLILLIGLQGSLFAQKSPTERTFSIYREYVNIRDFVHTPNYDMVLEMDNVNDFTRLKRLDSILEQLQSEIAFYKDSLRDYSGNVSIDYVIDVDHDYRAIRFRKHIPNGETFVHKDGEPSRLKIEQDTVNLIMRVKGAEILSHLKGKPKKNIAFSPQYYVQITLKLNNYSDIGKVIADRKRLRHIVDTIEAATLKNKDVVAHPHINQSTVVYSMYTDGRESVESYKGILQSPYPTPWGLGNRRDKLVFDINAGIGLIRNTLTPMAEAGISLYNRRGYNQTDYNTYITLSVSPYFFFHQAADGRFYTYDNWFVNLSAGGAGEFLGVKAKLLMGGVGYLFAAKGNYFKNTTMKAFMTIKVKDGFTVSPEIIFTNDFKQIFPGITLKVF